MSQALENDISREVWKVYKRVMEEEDFTRKSKMGALQFKASPKWRQVIEECYGHMEPAADIWGPTPEKLAYAVDMGSCHGYAFHALCRAHMLLWQS